MKNKLLILLSLFMLCGCDQDVYKIKMAKNCYVRVEVFTKYDSQSIYDCPRAVNVTYSDGIFNCYCNGKKIELKGNDLIISKEERWY